MRPVSKCGRRDFLFGGLAVMLAPVGEALAASTVVGPIRSVQDYTEAIAFARLRNRHALVDVAAEWCAFCKTIDGEILVHPMVRARMSDFALLKIDVTAWTADNTELLHFLNVQGPPTVFIAETEQGQEVPGTRTVGDFDIGNLVGRLESVR
ncbi:MAG: thioredoxin family protein [Allorhizobium sp.]